ncbi:MAG: type II toxin-antitoxin system HicA family toxin [Dethiobacter sp.]|nr:type II toxin-antitoxin system HicA family toxin [Dethiobacter sp.]MBS3897888.1 type II toxin-antitoxin system HicA family toxin [Dethiobacter sp.]
MSKREKLITRLLSRPNDFTFDELTTLLGFFQFKQVNLGKTSGSRVAFSNGEGDFIRFHKPHPRNILKPYQVADIITALQERGLL